MGTTLTALLAGSTQFVYVVAIEGYKYLLTNGDTTAVLTAWAGTDWATDGGCKGGLFVEMRNKQAIHPYQPLQGGGECVLHVVDEDGTDQFGIDTHKKITSTETELTASIDCDDTTVAVKATTGWSSSGLGYIGTECFKYTGTTSTSFTTCTRGMFSPFAAAGSETTRFAHPHRVGADSRNVKLAPAVSEIPRTWVGKWVGIWAHRVVGNVLDTKAEAYLMYAGRITDVHDDPKGWTTVELRHVLDVLVDGTVGRAMWTAKSKEGVYLLNGMTFRLGDYNGTSVNDGTDLVVTTGASGSYQIEPGYYSVAALHGALNGWFALLHTTADVHGDYAIYLDSFTNPRRTSLAWKVTGSGTVRMTFVMPRQVADFMGFGQAAGVPSPGNHVALSHQGAAGATNYIAGTEPALRSVLYKHNQSAGTQGLNFEVTEEQGTFVDQYDTLPSSLKPAAAGGLTWGAFLFDDKILMRGAYVAGATTELQECFSAQQSFGNAFAGDLEAYKIPYEEGGSGQITVRQIYIFEASTANILKALMYSTGTEGYNSATYDILPAGTGLAIPGDVLGPEFEASCDALPGATNSLVVTVAKPTRLLELLEGDLMLRRAFSLWKQEHLRFGYWQAPTTEAATATGGGTPIELTEANKGEPSGSDGDHRTATTQTSQWRRPIVKVQYNRDFTDLTNEGFRSEYTLEDKTAVDDCGDDAPTLAIKARNTYSQFANTGAGVESLASTHLETLTMFSRTAHTKVRSIDPALFEKLSVGDVVLFEDDFSRDPSTGRRGTSAQPATVIGIEYGWGGMAVGSKAGDDPEEPGGEVTLFFSDRNASLAGALYSPSADIDDTMSSGGYSAGYLSSGPTIQCYARRYNQSATYYINGSAVLVEEDADATYFPVGAKFKIIEKDPLVADNPTKWEGLEVTAQSGNLITFTPALTSPAWDSSKKYRIVPEDYDAATATQKQKAFQADDADGMILDTSAPNTYGTGSAERYYEADTVTEIELPPSSVYVDGAPRDAGHEAALFRLLDHNIDRKTAIQSALLHTTPLSNTSYSGGYLLVACTEIYLTREILSNAVLRELTVAPWYRSSDGTDAYLRVTLARNRPYGSSLQDVDRGAIYAEGIWHTTSTTWATGSDRTLDCRVKYGGLAFLLIEAGYKCETRGLAKLVEGARTSLFFGVEE